jgi:preprotein translocase subunit SecG
VATLIAAIHVLVCLALILVVLLQSGRAADLAGAFGGAGSQTAFGPRGAATFLSKATTILAVIFMLTSLGLAVYASRSGSTGSVLEQTEQPAQGQTAPAQAPGTQPAGQPAGQTPPSQQPSQQPTPSKPGPVPPK